MASAAAEALAARQPVRAGSETRELLLALTQKVDTLSLQVGHLYERTVAAEELKEDLVRIARDAMSALQVELSAIEHEFNADEIVHLLRQLLRSTPRFIRMLEHLESFDSLMQEMGPLSKEMLRALVDRLQEWEERGYFTLAQDLLAVVDRLAQHAKEGDLGRLAERVEPLIETLEHVSRPEVLQVANRALGTIGGTDGAEAKPVGLWGMARATRDPAVRRGLGVLVELLRQLGAQPTDESAALVAKDSEQRLLTGAKE